MYPSGPDSPAGTPDWPCGLLTTDGSGVIIEANDTLLRWTGLDRDALIGRRRLRDLLTVGGRILYETHIDPLLAMQDEVSEIALELVGAADAVLPVLLSAVAIGSQPSQRIVRMALFPATQRRAYERELLEARRLAEQAGTAREQVQRRLTLLADVNLVLSGTLGLATALERLATMLSADRRENCIILTVDEDDPARPMSVAAAAHEDPERHEKARLLGAALIEAEGFSGLRGGLTHPTPHLLPAIHLSGQGGQAVAIGPAAIVPVRARDRQVATLLLAREVGEAEFTRDDLLELAALAEPIGLFIDNLRLYAREHNRAVALQEALLTPAVKVAGVEIATHYVPGADGAMVGGDWYDSLERADGTTIVAIGDVTGHDHNAAAAMGQLRGLLRAIAYIGDDSPAEILTKTDRAARGLGVSRLATAAVVEFNQADPATALRYLRWASAGHLPPALITAGGQVRLLDAKPQLLLGVDPDIVRRDHREAWQTGDTLVMYTDGLIENQYRSLDVGLATLTTTLTGLTARPLHELCESLIAGMAGGRGTDDIVVMAIRAT